MAEGDDFDFNSIFLSQRVTNNNVTTQEANKAADFLLNANDDLNSTGEVIEYFDFSKENESVPASNDMQNSRRTTDDNSAKMPLEAENLFNKAQEEVTVLLLLRMYLFLTISHLISSFLVSLS